MVHGIQGVPSVNNHPPHAYEACEWKDKLGNFWAYMGGNSGGADLWKYNPVTNEWTWVKGNALLGQQPVYGLKGVPDPANSPGERSFGIPTWVDTTGNLWLFGGNNYDNDLWRYDISTNEWTWISGDTIVGAAGIHGIQGVPSVSNIPGARTETCSSWTDSLNNLWLFGGLGYDDTLGFGFLNDLWKYNIATNEWTWMKGSVYHGASVNYGTRKISNTTNDPGGRFTYTKWKDMQENFWIMGGQGQFSTNGNDVWKFDIGINEWTWMAGNAYTNDTGFYQAMCIYDSINIPAGRLEHRSSVTDNCGRFWLFGGGSNNGALNDLWIFDPGIQQLKWNWVSNSNARNQSANFGIKGVPSSSNIPGCQVGALAWWGNDNKFYLYGGRSDLWVFNPDTNCTHPCSAPLVSAGFQSMNNLICPGSCTDFINLSFNATSYHWNFFGAVPDTSAAINPSNICYANSGNYDVQLIATNANGSDTLTIANYITVDTAPQTSFAASPFSFCPGTCTDFTNSSTNATSYQWNFPGSTVDTSTLENPSSICYNLSGQYDVTLISANGICTDTLTISNYITVFAPPSSLSIVQSGDTLLSIAGFATYQWYYNSNIINGATDYFYVATQNGDYNLVATDTNGCEVEAAIFNVITAVAPLILVDGVVLYPNPSSSKLSIVSISKISRLKIFDLIGMEILSQTISGYKNEIDIRSLSSGIYFLQLQTRRGSVVKKFIKE